MTSAAAGRESELVRTAATLVAVYEIVALWTDLPTVTRLCHLHPAMAGAIVGGLAVHFQPKVLPT